MQSIKDQFMFYLKFLTTFGIECFAIIIWLYIVNFFNSFAKDLLKIDSADYFNLLIYNTFNIIFTIGTVGTLFIFVISNLFTTLKKAYKNIIKE